MLLSVFYNLTNIQCSGGQNQCKIIGPSSSLRNDGYLIWRNEIRYTVDVS